MTRSGTGYWIATGLFCLVMGFSGSASLAGAEFQVVEFEALGYPLYLMKILGVLKLLGVVALLVPGKPLLKEWAYAGFVFDLGGASVSHLFAGDPVVEAVQPLVLLSIAAVSYALRPAGRRLVSTGAGPAGSS